MTLTELIKKLEELNDESANSVKPVKLSVFDEMDNEWTINISKVSLVDDHIEIE